MSVDLDEETYANIRASTEASMRLQEFQPPDAPKEAVMSLDSVMEQRRKVGEILARFKERAKVWTEGPRGE